MQYIKIEDVEKLVHAMVNQGTTKDFKKYMKDMTDEEKDSFINRFVRNNLSGKIHEI